jgi:predicted HTH domain antitoxin
MESQALVEFNEILEPLGTQSAQFFLAASLYHAKKVSFNRAAELAGLSFEDFLARLKEQYSG